MSQGYYVDTATDTTELLLKYTGTIDSKTIGDTLFYTTENNGKRFHVTRIWMENVTIVAPTIFGSVNVGTNSATYDNIVSGGSMGAYSVEKTVIPINITTGPYPVSVPVNTAIYVRVNSASTGTTWDVRVHMEGKYLP